MIPTKCDPSLYFSFRNGDLIGMNRSYVDDLLRAGTFKLRSQCERTHAKFETTGDERLPITFAGFRISADNHNLFTIDQYFYLPKLEQLDVSIGFPESRSMRMKIAWLANTRPDMQFEISQLAQITEERFYSNSSGFVKRMNQLVRYAHDNVAHLKFPKLKQESLRIDGFSEAAYANNHDITSQLGRIILVTDDTNADIPISFKSYKSRRVVRSVLSAEVIAFADMFDDAYAIRTQVQQAIRCSVPMHLMTDSKSLFDIISKGSRTIEKRIMLDIHAARHAYQCDEISNIGFARSADNIADGLRKRKKQASFLDILHNGKHVMKCEQWKIRDNPSKK